MPTLHQTIIAGFGLAGFAGAAPVAQPDYSSMASQWLKNTKQTITWGSCPDMFPGNFTCATLRVPLDWNRVDNYVNETIELGMIRREADDKANRIGYLFINPGGPGGQATSAVVEGVGELDSEILARFDVVGLDPRGVGLSTPLQCDPAQFNKRIKFMPKTAEEYDALVQYNKDLGASCVEKSGRLVQYVDTISAAKDHEAVRLALGEKANYLGLSYGTQLFGQYAQLFPNSFRAIVLDGNLQHSQTESTNLLVEATTYEMTLKQFFLWCDSTESCALYSEDTEAVFKRVRDKATETPIPAPGCDNVVCRSDVTAEEILFSLQGFLVSQTSWPGFAEALLEADNGNATILSNGLATGDVFEDSYLYAGTAIGCQDWAHASTDVADLVAKENLGAVFSPLILGSTQSYKLQTECIGWPAPLTNPPAPITYKGKTKLLMLNSLYDPETSYTWALGLQSEIQNAVLVTRNGSGHTSYLIGGETTDVANAYFLNLTLPEPGLITST
ncbi:TAP-like protein-domain-containing protein [Xylaria intraflava]|nr:TAP-like protein-domain-containing protein [Xylaria intraflava]